ncbi:hypothetical protein MKX03_003155 [Papaver bracteatum]|nr:hypothetical protein MKX03_003155 [Papaver bracteatum]
MEKNWLQRLTKSIGSPVSVRIGFKIYLQCAFDLEVFIPYEEEASLCISYISFLCSRRQSRCFCSFSLKTEIDKILKQHKNTYYAFWRLGSKPSKWNPEDASRQCIIPTRDIDSNVEPNGHG